MTVWTLLATCCAAAAVWLVAGRGRADARVLASHPSRPRARASRAFRAGSTRRGVAARARPSPRSAGGRGPRRDGAIPDHLLAEIVAALVESGGAPLDALRRIADDLGEHDDPRELEWRAAEASISGHVDARNDRVLEGVVGTVAAAIALAGRTGLSPAELIRSAAGDARRLAAEQVARRLGRLPVVLVLPMGLCLLPAAVLLGVVPVVLGLLVDVLP